MSTESELLAEVEQLKLDLDEERQRTLDLQRAIAARDHWQENVQELTKKLQAARRKLKEAGWSVALYTGRRRRKPGPATTEEMPDGRLCPVQNPAGDVAGAVQLERDPHAAPAGQDSAGGAGDDDGQANRPIAGKRRAKGAKTGKRRK